MPMDEAKKYAVHLMRLIVQARTNTEYLTHGICQTDDGNILEMSITNANMCDVNKKRHPPLNSPDPTRWGEELAMTIMFTAGELALHMLPWSDLVLRFEVKGIERTLIIENESTGVGEITMHGCDDLDVSKMGEDIQRLDNGLLNLVIVDGE